MEAEKRDGECDGELDSENKSLTTTKDGEDVERILKKHKQHMYNMYNTWSGRRYGKHSLIAWFSEDHSQADP